MSKEQRITEAEHNEAWAVFSDRNKYLSLSDEQTVMVDAFVDAGKIKQETGEWPTLGEVCEKWGSEAEEQERLREEREKKHAALMHVWNGQRAAKQKV